MKPVVIEYGVERTKRTRSVLYFFLAQLPCALMLFYGIGFWATVFPPFGPMWVADHIFPVRAGTAAEQQFIFTPWEQVIIRGELVYRRRGEQILPLHVVYLDEWKRVPTGSIETECGGLRLLYNRAVPLAILSITLLIILVRAWILILRRWLFGKEE